MEFCERVSGARMHTALHRPNEFDHTAITHNLQLDLSKFLIKSSKVISGSFISLLNNRVLKSRLVNVGSLSEKKTISYGITGILARSTGCKNDLRLSNVNTYGAY
jgi:NADH-quinone oxidoreductase subunit D